MDKTDVFADDDYCFACGSKNPLGLQLTFTREGDDLCTIVHPPVHWQGFRGIMHGGLQSTVMDDLMSNFLMKVHGIRATTAELSCRYRKPVPTESGLEFRARLRRQRGRVWEIHGVCTAIDEPHVQLTTAFGRFFELARLDAC